MVKALRGAQPPRFVVAPIQAFLQPVPTAEALAAASRTVQVGDSIQVEELAGWLVGQGMARVEVVEVAGEFSLRGGILDVFPPDASDPVRVEFFGDEVESIRAFDAGLAAVAGQARPGRADLDPRSTSGRPADLGHAADALPAGTWVVLVEPSDLPRRGEALPRPRRGPQGACSRPRRPSPG